MEIRVEPSDYFGCLNDENTIELDAENLLFFDKTKSEIVHVKIDHCLVCSLK